MPSHSPVEFSGPLVTPRPFYKQWMLAGNRAVFFDRLVEDWGDFVHYRGLFNFYLINHPSLVKRVLLRTGHEFDKKTIIYNRFRNVFGGGLVVADGDQWKRRRNLLQQVFGPTTVKQFFSVMVDAAAGLADAWETGRRDRSVFDISRDMNRVTLEVAGRALFHDAFGDVSEQISRWTHTINRYSAKPPLPIVRSFWFPSHVNYGVKRVLREFDSFLQSMIDDRRGVGERAAGPDDDLLSILLRTKHEETGQSLSDREIKEEVLGLIIGGHETSSAALTWAWYELHRNPLAQQRLCEEINAVVGDDPLTLDHIPQLNYARMVIDETIRLHPPFWFENRNVAEDVELGGALLKKGSLVAFSRYSLHRHRDFWAEPHRFDPDRFEPGSEENSHSSHAFIPFGGGPRVCIGVHFATLELVVMLCSLVRRYRVVVDESDRHQMAANLTMTPAFGLQVRLEPR
ncbi:MAG: cytochrome P450 [Pirellulaceae bacterium]|jgi:cytochrome P450|nr:cytochrome P450 [Pirellulaceae bacterium]MDP7016237.1 cytochrome P450 [Pirellulaceae bacterium]